MYHIRSFNPARNLISTVWTELGSYELKCDLLKTALSKIYWVERATSSSDDFCLCPAFPFLFQPRRFNSIFAALAVKCTVV